MNEPEWTSFVKALNDYPSTTLNLTVDKEGVSIWRIQKESGAYIGFAIVAIAFAANNLVLAVIALLRHPLARQRSIVSLCLCLEIVAHVVRLLFGMDPLAPWKLWPYPVETMFYTISIPISLMSMVLLTLYWQDLVDFSSLEISSVLSRSKGPAIIIAIVAVGMEVASVSVRATDVNFSGGSVVHPPDSAC